MNNSLNKTSAVVALDLYPAGLYDYAFPTIFIVTLAINCVIIHVRLQPNMWGTPLPSHRSYANNRMLFAIAICHAQTFACPTLFQLYQHTIGSRNSIAFCYGWHLMVVVMPQVHYTVSNILVAVLSVMRYCCQHYPFQVNEWFRMSNVIRTIAGCSIFGVVVNVPKFVEKVFHFDGSCEIEFTRWSLHYSNRSSVLAHILFWTQVIFAREVVCIVIVIFSLLAIWECNRLANREPRVSGQSFEYKRLRNEFVNRSKLVAVAYCSILILEILLSVIRYQLLDTIHPYSMITSVVTFVVLCIGPVAHAFYSYISKEFCDTYKATYTRIRNKDEGTLSQALR